MSKGVPKGAPIKQNLCKQRATAGLCSRCGKGPPASGCRLCPACLEVHRRSRRQMRTYSDENRQKQSAHLRNIYDKRKASGLCARCGLRPPTEEYLLCQLCLDQQYKSVEEAKKRRNHEYDKRSLTNAVSTTVIKKVIEQPTFDGLCIGDQVAMKWTTQYRDDGQGAGGVVELITPRYVLVRNSCGYKFTVSLADLAIGVKIFVQKEGGN